MPKRSEVRLSDRWIRAQETPTDRTLIVYDCDLPGFGVRITPTGAIAFVLNYVVDRKERRLTIGRFPAWSTNAAREEARALKRRIDLGIDPLEEASARTSDAVAARQAPTIADLYERYEAEHLPGKAKRSGGRRPQHVAHLHPAGARWHEGRGAQPCRRRPAAREDQRDEAGARQPGDRGPPQGAQPGDPLGVAVRQPGHRRAPEPRGEARALSQPARRCCG